jgi:hypothetical protein
MWDWTFVGELAVGLTLGIGVGGWFVVDRLEKAMLRVAGHPSVRKMANAADKLTQGGQGGWAGVAQTVVGGVMNWLGVGGGGGGPPGKNQRVVVVDTEGNVLGEAEAR